ncbi:MAG: hypothetical protein V7754_20545 [Halioglobus sp.]
MSLFRIVKYSSLIFFLGKYKSKLFRVVGVLLFAAVTSLLYGDVEHYLQQQHPGVVVYALLAKILIVYGALAFVLWQFRPEPEGTAGQEKTKQDPEQASSPNTPSGPLSQLEDIGHKENLRSRYEGVLKSGGKPPE